jgi:hypothetical protein
MFAISPEVNLDQRFSFALSKRRSGNNAFGIIFAIVNRSGDKLLRGKDEPSPLT